MDVLVRVGSATGCGLVSAQPKQEAKQKVEARKQHAKKQVKAKGEQAAQEVKEKVQAGQEDLEQKVDALSVQAQVRESNFQDVGK
jgi:F0F1-type ATP synthase membrane subunit b/b'